MQGNRRAQLIPIVVLALFAAAAAAGLGEASSGAGQGSSSGTLVAPLSAAAAAKVDPRLGYVLAAARASRSDLMRAARQVIVQGAGEEDLRLPVLIRTSLDNAQLAALGAIPDTRIGDIVTAVVSAGDVDRLASHPGVLAIEASTRLLPSLDVSIPEIRANLINQGQPPTGYTGAGVLFGQIDSGLDLTHEDFKDAQGHSRVLYAWSQAPGNGETGSPPAGYTYGIEYTKALIDAGSAVNFRDTGGHGSHVAGIAVGDGSTLPNQKYRGVAPEADMLFVRNGVGCDFFCYGGGMPPWTTSSGYTKGSIDGLNYLLQKAQALGKPLVVNQSQGSNAGPHDGTTLFEQAYQQLIDQNHLIICIASGNEQDADWHGRVTVTAGGQGSMRLRHYTDAQTDPASYLYFECWYKQGDQFRWQLVSPGGSTLSIPSAVSPSEYPWVSTTRPDTLQYWTTTDLSVNHQGCASFWLFNSQLGVEAGEWEVRAIAENGLPAGGVVDLYCESGQYNLWVTTGVSREGTIDMPGSVAGAISVGSYNTKNEWDSQAGHTVKEGYPLGEISFFSSTGPRRDGLQKPEIAAPGVWIMSALSKDKQEQQDKVDPSGKYRCIGGTSMASPHAAGAVALMLQKNPALTPAEVKTALQQTARTDGYTGTVPNVRFGYGKLDVKAAVDAVGSSGNCATQSGDATGDNAVNVLDIVATVNDILQTTPLGTGARACADMDGNSSVNVLDVVAIVNKILHPGLMGRSLASGAEESIDGGGESEGAVAPVSWSEEFGRSSYRFRVDGTRVGGLQLSLVLPRGYAMSGEPALVGASTGVVVTSGERLGQHTVLAYNGAGGSLGSGEVTLEISVEQAWAGGQELRDLAVTGILLSDAQGRGLALTKGVGEESGRASVGVGAWLGGSVPNPSSGLREIRYGLGESGEVRLTVHDASGRRLRELWSGWQMAGGHTVVWDGRDDGGSLVSAGVYFVQLRGAGAADSRKILVVR